MTPLLFVLLALAGGVGASARFVLDGAIKSISRTTYPVGTTVINLSGSLLLGFLTGLALAHLMSDDWRLVLGTGFLGGYTTFSTASLETVRLAQQRQWRRAFLNGLGMLAASILLALAGYLLGAAL
jgi:fluoride exporter